MQSLLHGAGQEQNHVLWLATCSLGARACQCTAAGTAGATDASAEPRKICRVLILIAMEAEGMPLLGELDDLIEDEAGLPDLPALCYTGTYRGLEVVVVMNGQHPVHGVTSVGTTAAAVTAYAALRRFKPDLLLNAGTAGGFKRWGGAIGDVYVSTSVVLHDRRIPIPGFEGYEHGRLPAFVPDGLLKAQSAWKEGIVTTSNSLDFTPEDEMRMRDNGASVKEMEAAAIADVAQGCGVPFMALKVITDIVDGDRPTQDEFTENLGTAAASLQKAVPAALGFIAAAK
jgi:5'-methylthioadenosine nucleosidase